MAKESIEAPGRRRTASSGAGCGVRSDTLSFIAESLDNVFAALNIMVDKVPACKDFARDLFQDNNSESNLLYFNLGKLLYSPFFFSGIDTFERSENYFQPWLSFEFSLALCLLFS